MTVGRVLLGIVVLVVLPFQLVILLGMFGAVGPVEIGLIYLIVTVVATVVFLTRRRKRSAAE